MRTFMKNKIRELSLSEINSVSGGPLPPPPQLPPPYPDTKDPDFEPLVITRDELQRK